MTHPLHVLCPAQVHHRAAMTAAILRANVGTSDWREDSVFKFAHYKEHTLPKLL